MRATTLTKPGPVQQPPTEPEATPAGWCTTRADPHTSWTEPRGPVMIVLLAIGGGIFLSKLLFVVLIVALVVAVLARRSTA